MFNIELVGPAAPDVVVEEVVVERVEDEVIVVDVV